MNKRVVEGGPSRIGIIGVGHIVERAHLPLLAQMPDATVVGLFDKDYNRTRTIAERNGIPVVCRNLYDLFDLGLDITLVACPTYLHAEMSVAALKAGTHVLCEKPMAMSVGEADMMIRTAERQDRELMIAFANRFRPEVIAIRKAIESGWLGEVKSIRCGWLRRNGVPGTGSWFTNRLQSGGGVLTDLGSHLIDLVNWFCGGRELLSAQCVVDRTWNVRTDSSWYMPSSSPTESIPDVEISASAFAVLAGPIDVFVEVSWAGAAPHDQTYFTVTGTRGVARLETLFGFSPAGYRPRHPLKLWVDGKPASLPITGAVDLLQPYRDQWRFFIDSLRNKSSLRPALYDGLATVQTIERMYSSADRAGFITSASTRTSALGFN